MKTTPSQVLLAVFAPLTLLPAHNISRSYGVNTLFRRSTLSTSVVLDKDKSEEDIRAAIKLQLYFIVGQLLEKSSIGIERDLKIKILSSSQEAENSKKIEYQAEFPVLIEDSPSPPQTFQVILPKRVDEVWLGDFAQKYIVNYTCGNGDGDLQSLWYHYQPFSPNCPLKENTNADSVITTMKLSEDSPSPQKSFPEYSRLWANGKLEATIVFGNQVSRGGNNQHLLERLKSKFGMPIFEKSVDKTYFQVADAEYQTKAGKLEIHAFDLVNTNLISVLTFDEFKRLYEEKNLLSNVIIYNGHAGHGKNIRALTKLQSVVPNRYYLYWINSCLPFTYVDKALFEKFEEKNPGTKASKNLDFLTVAHFGDFSEGNEIISLFESLVEKRDSFQELLPKLNSHGVVLGDEDNP